MLRRLIGGSKQPTENRGQQGRASSSSRLIGRPSQASASLASASTSASSGTIASSSSGASSRASPSAFPGAQSSACAAAEDRIVLTVVRSRLWSQAGAEDVWKVEIRSSASVGELKARIAALYEIPVQVQRLQKTGDPGDPCLPDKASVRDVARHPIYLLPAQEASPAEVEAFGQELDGIHLDVDPQGETEEDQIAAVQAIAESLQGVIYNVAVIRPKDPMGAFQEVSMKLKLDALALVGDVQARVEAELLGQSAGDRQWCLLFNGQALPPNVPIHFAGIGEGATLIVVPGCAPGDEDEDGDDSDSDSLDDAILNWANGR